MSALLAPPFAAFSELSGFPLPDSGVESWLEHEEYSQVLSSASASASASVCASACAATGNGNSLAMTMAPGQLNRHSSIFPSLSVAPIQVAEKHSSAADVLPVHVPHLMSLVSVEKSAMAEGDNCLHNFHSHTTAHLSPFSDASTPSDLDHPHSPYSPHHCEMNGDCCASLSSTYPSNPMAVANDDTDSRATSPSLASDDELSQINQNLQDDKLATPPFPASIAPQPSTLALPSLTLNSNTIITGPPLETSNAKPIIDPPTKTETPVKTKSKRSRRRNLIRALKEQSADGNLSGSEGEHMNLQSAAAPVRSKRSYIALLGDEGKVVEDEEEDAKTSGNKRDRNKASASAYRKRRKIYLDTLEARVASLNERLKEKDDHMAKVENENRVLKEQVSFLKRLISFKATDQEDINTSTPINGNSDATPASSSSSSSSSAFGISPSRLSFGQFTTNGSSRHASVFLFLLFCCFLLFNPQFTGMNLSAGLSDSSSVGRSGRSLLSVPNSVEHVQMRAPHPYLMPTATVNEVNEAAHQRYVAETATKKELDVLSVKEEHNSSFATSSSSSSSSSTVSPSPTPVRPTAAVPSDHEQAWQALTQLADHFHMEPTSQQFAELVAAAYLPLVSILGEAATQAALRDLANGVFFVQHQALLQAVTHAASASANSSAFSQ